MADRSLRDALIGAAAVTKLRLDGTAFPPVASARGTRTLFIGPANSAGQGYAWARAAENADDAISAVSMTFARRDDRFRFAVDQAVDHRYGVHSSTWQRRQFAAVSEFDAILLESGIAPFTKMLGGSAAAQTRALAANGARVALVFHGSDIRDPDAHLSREPLSHFAADAELTAALRRSTAANRALIAELDLPVFVSTPDLLHDVPGARWLPVVVDAAQWRSESPALTGSAPLRVAHVPSKSLVKGTDLIEPVLTRLQDAGAIEYRPVSGVAHAEMPRTYGAADIVLDQFRVGSYGVAACEALAAGRLVIGHVSDDVRASVRDLTGDELPIVEATPDTLAAVLTDIDEHRERYAEISASGQRFAARHHDGRLSGRVIAEWMEAT